MPKMTTKWVAALGLANRLGIPAGTDQEGLYATFQARGYFWDSGAQTWNYHNPDEAKPARLDIAIRIIFDAGKVEYVRDDVVAALEDLGYQLSRDSEAVPRRPPENNDASIYLYFLPPKGKRKTWPARRTEGDKERA